MSIGAFGENFPYSNFHDLNMDWIIKIAKDFLDQYTHIQEVIQQGEESITNQTNTGIEQLETLATNIETALNNWYETHSSDIANQLLQAIADFNTASTAKSQALLDSWPEDYSELVTEYNNLKTALYVSLGLDDEEITYNHVSGYYPINTDEYMDIQKEYTKGTIIKQIVVQNDSATGTNQLQLSFWKQVNNQMVLYKTQSISGVVIGSTIVFDVNEQLPYNTYISYKDSDIISTIITERGLVPILPDTTAFNKSYFTTNSIRYQMLLSVYYIEKSNLPVGLVVHVGEGQDYEEIQDALEDTGNDNLTIVLHPRNYPYSKFSMMRSFSESYPWTGISTVRNISIIGMDIDKCIIEDDSGLYYSPAAEIACNGIIRNVKFIATHNSANYQAGDNPSYAVHVDNRPADSNGMKLTFENCIFISYQCAAVGVGVYRNQSITFKYCEFYNKTPNNFSPYTNYDTSYNNTGAIIVHTSMGENKGNDYFNLIGNILVTDNNRYAMLIRETEASPTCTFEFINNTLWNISHEDTEIKWEGPGTIIQSPYNRLNNNQDINMETYNFPRVINNLNSSSTTDALSAAQGKALKESIPNVIDNLNSTSATDALSAAKGKTLNDNISPFLKQWAWIDGTKPTLTNGSHYGEGTYYFKIGCFIYLSISAEFSSPPSNALLFTLPEGCRPIGGAEISVSGGASYNAKAQCVIGVTGGVRVSSVDNYVAGSGIFLIGG